MDDDLIAYARQAFGWPSDLTVSAGPRGALGQIWRVDVAGRGFALKELFTRPEGPIEPELDFARRALDVGVRLPRSHPDRDGNYVVKGEKWLRVYDWVDLRPVDLSAPGTPRLLGELFARLHRCAPAMTAQANGEVPDRWYHTVPAAGEWSAPAASDAVWAARLRKRLPAVPELSALVTPPEPDELILCHRDLHPENVLADPGGELVVVDWDNMGPAAPGREIAQALFDWYAGPEPDLDAMRDMYEVYVDAGGPGRITTLADFSMLIAVRLNFLLLQTRTALDLATERRHREWAEREIDEALRNLPTPQHLAGVLTLTRPSR